MDFDDIDDIDILEDDRKKLKIDAGTRLQLFIKGVTIPVTSIFIGMKTDEYVVISQPAPFQPIKHRLVKDAHLVVKFLYEGTVSAFQTKVLGTVSDPIKLTILSFPDIVQNYNLRSLKRINCYLPIKLLINGEIRDGVIRDISKKGCRCKVQPGDDKKSIIKGKEIAMKCQFPGIKEEQGIIGRIMNAQELDNKKELDVGIEFIKMSSYLSSVLPQYISFYSPG
ncbi:MAG: flagellar brake protein [Desulfobacterales bacterium]|nr:flagellar brake protein [Desulfobacterales bacterium]MBF0395249.1 flagellar brake protein [Desulfobacterales bacterium]